MVPNSTAYYADFALDASTTPSPYTVTLTASYAPAGLDVTGDDLTLYMAGYSLSFGSGQTGININSGASASASTPTSVVIDGGTAQVAGTSTITSVNEPMNVGSGTSYVNLTFQNGANLTTAELFIGGQTSSTPGSNDSILIQEGATVKSDGPTDVGYGGTTDANDSLTVTGAGSALTSAGAILVGNTGIGSTGNSLTVENDATLTASSTATHSELFGKGANTTELLVESGGTANFTAGPGFVDNGQAIVVTGGTLNIDGLDVNTASGYQANITINNGTMNLSGTTTFAQATTAGTVGDGGTDTTPAVLNFNNTSSTSSFIGTFSVASNGEVTGTTYAGTGTVDPSITTTSASALIAPGTVGSPAGTPTLTLASLDATKGATFAYDLASGGVTQLLSITGNLTTGAGTVLTFNLNNMGATAGTTYQLMTFASTNGATVVADSIADGVAGTFGTNSTDTDLTFTVASVPEPSTTGLLLGAGLIVLLGGVFRRTRMALWAAVS